MASWFSKWRFGKGRRTWGRKQSVFLRIQVRAGSQTKGLERGWKRRVRLRRDAITTLTPRFTNFFTDFEEKNRLFCSLWRSRVPQQYLLSDRVVRSCAEQTNLRFGEPTPDAKKRIKGSMRWWRKTELSNHHILNFSLRLQINCRIHICTFCAWSWKLFTIEWMISQQKPRLWTDVAIIMAIWSFFLFFLLLFLFRLTEESRSLSMAWAVECCVWLRN